MCVMRGDVNRLCSYLCSNGVERESQETHKREKGEWKQSQVQDNEKVKCALNGSVQSERDKAQPAARCVQQRGMAGQVKLYTYTHISNSFLASVYALW